jgi:hypothetical protein
MFSILLDLVGSSMVGYSSSTGSWIVAQPGLNVHDGPAPVAPKKLPYETIMQKDASDGVRFVKPERGHEDGCVSGVCQMSGSK